MASNIQPTGLDWKNLPQKTTPISAENLNKMANTIDDLVEAVNPLNTVEANPEGTPTEGLEKVEIDGTLYEVKGGHKILNDSGTTLTQKDNLQFKGVYTQNNGDNTEVDICRTMTKAQMEALSGEALKGFINTSDEPDSLPLTTDWVETDNGDSLTDRIIDIEDGIESASTATGTEYDLNNSVYDIIHGLVKRKVYSATTDATGNIDLENDSDLTYANCAILSATKYRDNTNRDVAITALGRSYSSDRYIVHLFNTDGTAYANKTVSLEILYIDRRI